MGLQHLHFNVQLQTKTLVIITFTDILLPQSAPITRLEWKLSSLE